MRVPVAQRFCALCFLYLVFVMMWHGVNLMHILYGKYAWCAWFYEPYRAYLL